MAALLSATMLWAQSAGISGRVLDEAGQPVIGAAVSVKGTTVGVTTGLDGSFRLNYDGNAILVVSFLGYETQQKSVIAGTSTDIVLKADAMEIESVEVVSVGYGVQKKESVVGAISTVRPSDLQVPVRSLSQTLAGNVTGIVALQTSGEPGKDDAQFWIRGIATFTGDPNPLILVDGIERPLNNVDPLEIESFSVLRDASHRLWIGTKAGICVYDDGSDSIRSVYRSEYNVDIVDISEDRDGCVWFATMGNGLIRYDYSSDEFDRIPIGSGDRRSDFVSCLAMGAANVWIGTQGNGLWRYDIETGTAEHEFAGTKYADCTIFQIVQNGEELWLTTNHGLLQYDCGKRRIPVAFTSDDGLLANIFNFNSGFKSQSGHIYLGSNNGVNRFYPYDFVDLDSTTEPDVVFGGIEFLGRNDRPADAASAVDCLRRVEIRGGRVSFGLDFIALNYSSPLRTVYRYRLSGIDRDWITAGLNFRSGMQRVYYSDLPPGKYIFTVSASDDGGHFGRESSVEITVKAPWWMSNGMYAVYCIMILSGLVVAGFRWRHRVIDERRREFAAMASRNETDSMRARIDFATDSEDGICEPLSLISAMVAELSERNGLSVALQEDTDRIRRNCDVLTMRVNRMFDALRSGNIPAAERGNDGMKTESGKFPPPEFSGTGSFPSGGKSIAGQTDVLFVDSNEEYLDFALRNLARSFAVYGASGGREALEMLHVHRFSAVVCGAMSKENIDGIALCKAIKTDERLEDISVILLTTDASKQLKMQALLAGVDICLPKSVATDYLALQIRTLVDATNRRRLKYSRNPYLRPGADDSTLRTNNFMERLNGYIGGHISDVDLTVDDIAAALGVSRTQLFMRIKELTGTTPNELLRSVRLNRAAELFAERSDLRVSEICYMVGFTSVSYFAKCFRKRFGMLPNQYIERCRCKDD